MIHAKANCIQISRCFVENMDREVFYYPSIYKNIQSLHSPWMMKDLSGTINKNRFEIKWNTDRDPYSITNFHFRKSFFRKNNSFLFCKRGPGYIEIFKSFLMELFKCDISVSCFSLNDLSQPFFSLLSFIPTEIFFYPADTTKKEKPAIIQFLKFCFFNQ